MSGGGSKTKSTSSGTTTTTPTLPPELAAAYRNLTGIGQNLFAQSGDDQYASSYTAPSAATQMGAGMLAQRGLAGQPLANQAFGGLAGLIGSEPVAGTAGLEGLARGENSITAPSANQYQAGLASFGADQNPHLDATFNKAAEQVRTQVGNAANVRGLAGGAPKIEQNVLGKNLSGLATDIYSGAYENNMNRGLAGLQSAAGLVESGMDRGIGVQQQNINNRMNATQGLSGLASDLSGRQLAGIEALPGLTSYADQGIGQLLASGAITDADAQARMADQAAAQQFQQDQPWQRALQYAQLLGLSAGPQTGQTTTGTSTGTTKTNPGLMGWMQWAFPNGLGGGG